jgi:hypothetical protein
MLNIHDQLMTEVSDGNGKDAESIRGTDAVQNIQDAAGTEALCQVTFKEAGHQ